MSVIGDFQTAASQVSPPLPLQVLHALEVAFLGDRCAEFRLDLLRLGLADFLVGFLLTLGHRFSLSVTEAESPRHRGGVFRGRM
jgi:hypothetical protein